MRTQEEEKTKERDEEGRTNGLAATAEITNRRNTNASR